jgi:hypothetical protein
MRCDRKAQIAGFPDRSVTLLGAFADHIFKDRQRARSHFKLLGRVEEVDSALPNVTRGIMSCKAQSEHISSAILLLAGHNCRIVGTSRLGHTQSFPFIRLWEWDRFTLELPAGVPKPQFLRGSRHAVGGHQTFRN